MLHVTVLNNISVIVRSVTMPSITPNAFMPSVIFLIFALSCAIVPSVFTINALMLRVSVLHGITVIVDSVIMPSVIILNVVLQNVTAPEIDCRRDRRRWRVSTVETVRTCFFRENVPLQSSRRFDKEY
jgi:hypothetical protein